MVQQNPLIVSDLAEELAHGADPMIIGIQLHGHGHDLCCHFCGKCGAAAAVARLEDIFQLTVPNAVHGEEGFGDHLALTVDMDTVVDHHIRPMLFKGLHHRSPLIVGPAVVLVADKDIVALAAGNGIVKIAVDAGILIFQNPHLGIFALIFL